MIRQLLYRQRNLSGIATIQGDRPHTYRDLLRRSAALLPHLPRETGRVVAIHLPSGGDYLSALFGVLFGGQVAFPLGIQLTPGEIAPLLAKTKPALLITSMGSRPMFQGMRDALPEGMEILCMEDVTDGGDTALQVARAASVPPSDPMILLATSGTTGAEKIVTLSEQNVTSSVTGFIQYNGHDKYGDLEIRYILGTPFSSVYGLLVLCTCLAKSFPIVIPDEAVTLEVLYREAETHRVTHYEGGTAIPLHMDQMAGRDIPRDISSLHFVGFGGSKVASEVLTRLMDTYPAIDFCHGYGMTESAALIARPNSRLPREKLNSVGIPLPGMEIAIDMDGQAVTIPYATGEVLARGPNVMLGYFGSEKETEKALAGGYLHTGDIGYLDEDGWLILCGRKKNVIMVRGFSVFAEEVETCLMDSGLVRECLVYGKTDGTGNETLLADCVPLSPHIQMDDLRLHCAKFLAGYKQPGAIRLVEQIEKTATGKAKRRD